MARRLPRARCGAGPARLRSHQARQPYPLRAPCRRPPLLSRHPRQRRTRSRTRLRRAIALRLNLSQSPQSDAGQPHCGRAGAVTCRPPVLRLLFRLRHVLLGQQAILAVQPPRLSNHRLSKSNPTRCPPLSTLQAFLTQTGRRAKPPSSFLPVRWAGLMRVTPMRVSVRVRVKSQTAHPHGILAMPGELRHPRASGTRLRRLVRS